MPRATKPEPKEITIEVIRTVITVRELPPLAKCGERRDVQDWDVETEGRVAS